MSSSSQLIELYQEWGQLSAIEHEALKKEDWEGVSKCQSENEFPRNEFQLAQAPVLPKSETLQESNKSFLT